MNTLDTQCREQLQGEDKAKSPPDDAIVQNLRFDVYAVRVQRLRQAFVGHLRVGTRVLNQLLRVAAEKLGLRRVVLFRHVQQVLIRAMLDAAEHGHRKYIANDLLEIPFLSAPRL